MTPRRRRTPILDRSIARLLPEDRAVSPVIGMIMVLAISVVGISSILYWGLPAIDEMKANVEFRSVQTQFEELDATVKELVAGTTEKTAKRWQPSINRGSIVVHNGTEAWLYATELYNPTKDHNLSWGKFQGNQFTVYNRGTEAIAAVRVEAAIITGTSTSKPLIVTLTQSNTPVQMTGADLPSWTVGEDETFYVYKTTNEQQLLTGGTYRFRVYSGTTLIAEAWYTHVGRIDYRLDAGLGTKTLSQMNGAVLSGNGATHAIINTPSIPPSSTTSGVPRFFGRAIVLHGDGGFAGEDRFDLLISLYSTATLASYDCAEVSATDCVETSKIFIYGSQGATWNQYLSNTQRGYAFTKTNDPGLQTEYLLERRPAMGYTLLQSVVLLSG